MKLGIVMAVLVAALAAAGGYWMGQTAMPAGEHAAATPAAAAPAAERKVLYYRNPMGLADTSPTPKKDPMGMDYIPVYADDSPEEPAAANQIRISTDKVQKLGVRTQPAHLRALDRVVRAAGRVAPDERRVYAIAPKFEGYIERLDVNETGQSVTAGQPLFEVYSPDLIAAQREYIYTARSHQTHRPDDQAEHARTLTLEASELTRLRNWDISEDQLKALAKSGTPTRTLTFRSPVTGIVIEKKAVQGMRFLPGEELYRVVDLSTIWVLADVFEQDIGLIKLGAKANVTINAYPGKTFAGTITYVYPTLNPATRTVPVRVEMPNPGQLLKLDMFANVDMPVGSGRQVVTVPTSAVIDSGTRRIVLVQRGEGRFEPREVRLGQRSERDVEVITGVKDGETVVVTANFLIDAESNLKAALAGFGPATPGTDSPAAAQASHHAEGSVESIDAEAGTLMMNHGPVASLKWPAMTMEFLVADKALLTGLKPGLAVTFAFIERQPGEWVITSITPVAPGQRHPVSASPVGHG